MADALLEGCLKGVKAPPVVHTAPHARLRLQEEGRLKSEYESERGNLEQQYKERLDQIKSELEEEEAMQKRNMLKATDALVAEYKRQMEVGRYGERPESFLDDLGGSNQSEVWTL